MDRLIEPSVLWISSGIFLSPSKNTTVNGLPPPNEKGIKGYMRAENHTV